MIAFPDTPTVRDLRRKCGDDVEAAIQRSMTLIDGGPAKAVIALAGAATAIGTAGGAMLAVYESQRGASATSGEAADVIWEILRRMVVVAVDRIREERGRS